MAAVTLRSGLRLKNRIVFTSMGLDLADEGGCFTDALADFYDGIADGHVGAAVLANSSVSDRSRLHAGGLVLTEGAQRDALCKFTDNLVARGCAPFVQLQHYGPQGSTKLTGAPLLSPSAGPPFSRPASTASREPSWKVMTKDDIKDVIRQFQRSALLAESAGAQGIQIQASNGYLLSSFLSPFSNRRTDGYGGSIEGRSRIMREIVAALRSTLKSSTAVSVRMNVSDYIADNGISEDDVAACVHSLADEGVDLIELSGCVRGSFHRLLSPSDPFLDNFRASVRLVTQYSPVPIVFAGGTASLSQAEHLLGDDVCDLVGMSRALFADNDLITKTLSDKSDQIDGCLFDGNCFRDKSNPVADRVYCCVSKKYPRPKHIAY
nr:NADH:flavin oxidoreductase [Acetobacter sp. P5B1]